MTLDILFLDNDDTLGDFRVNNGKGLYPGVRDFLRTQNQAGRTLYIATGAEAPGRAHLNEIDSLLSGYFGREQIDVMSRGRLYFLPDGTIRKVEDDFVDRQELESPEKRAALDRESRERGDRFWKLPEGPEREALQLEIDRFFDYWGELLHKETRVPFDPLTLYNNPYCRHMKDLYLARRLISPQGYQEQRTLMVGDLGDTRGYASDPETPLIVISSRVRAGEWDLVARVVNHFFSDPERKPWQMFDELYTKRKNVEKKLGKVQFFQETYEVEVNEYNGRIIYCP